MRGGGITIPATSIDMEKPKIFKEDSLKVTGFISAYKIYIKNKIGEVMLEKKIL